MLEILHISDIHFRIGYGPAQMGYQGMLCRMRDPLEKLDFCLERAFAAHPGIGLVLLCGDLCEDGEAEDYHILRKHLEKRLTVPLAVTLGNHDRKDSFRKGWLGETARAEGDPCRPYNCALEIEGLHVLSLDSSVHGCSNGKLVPGQTEWLERELEKLGGAPSILMTHHHLLDGHESIAALPYPEKFAALVRENAVAAILCGHTHHCFAGQWQGKPYYTSDGMSFYGTGLEDGTVLFEEKYGYNYYCVKDGQIRQAVQETFSDGKAIAVVDMIKCR